MWICPEDSFLHRSSKGNLLPVQKTVEDGPSGDRPVADLGMIGYL
jgi:hypothetical protein